MENIDLNAFSAEHQEDLQMIGALMEKGDSRCKYPIGTKVKKIKSEEGDLTPPGVKGVVMGNLYVKNGTASKIMLAEEGILVEEIYLVKFDGDDCVKMCLGNKLRKLIFGRW